MDPPPNIPLDALAACPASYEDCMARAPQEAHQLGTPNAAPMPLDGGRTAPVAAPQCAAPPFVDPWLAEADAAGDPMLCGDALAPMDAAPSARPPKPLTPPARAPMALTPPVPPTAPMDAAPTAAAAPMALTPAVPPTAPMDAAPTATAAPMALTPAVPPSTAEPMDAAPTAAAAPMALTPPAPRAASDAAAPPVVVATAPAATKGKRVKRQTIGPGGPAAAAPPPPAPAAPPPPAPAAPPAAPPPPLAAPEAPPPRPPLPPGARVNAKGETIVRLRRPPWPPTPPPPPMNDVRVGARVAKSFPGFGARKWLGTISAQRTTGKWEVRWDDDPGYRQAYAETTMRKCLITGAAAAPPPPPATPATPATENRACLMCGESTRLPDGSLDADGCVRCDACAVEMCRDCSGQRRRRRTWRCDTCVNASGLGEAEIDDVVEEPASGQEERPMRRAASLDAATVLASRLDNNRNKPDVAASVLGPLAVAIPEARSRRPSDDTPPSNDDSDDDVATLRKRRSPSSSPRAGPVEAAAPARVVTESGDEEPVDTQPYDDDDAPAPPADEDEEPAAHEADEADEPVDADEAPLDADEAPLDEEEEPVAEAAAEVPDEKPRSPRARRRIEDEEEEEEDEEDDGGAAERAAAAEAEEAALLARLARCGADLGKAASEGDPAAATKALGSLEALGDIENGVSSYEGLGATGVIQALKQLKKQKTYKADATHAIDQATKLFERWKAANGDIQARNDADPVKARRLKQGVEALIAKAKAAEEEVEEEEDEEFDEEEVAMVIAENDRTARGVQRGDRLWALFDRDEHGQEWWGGTVIQADLNSRGDGDVDVVFDDGEREVMRAKECFRRCEAGILRSLRQARPNKKAERRLKQCGVAPRENHEIRLPPSKPAAPKKKKTAKQTTSVGARAQARAEAVWAAAARAPSSAADAWAAVERAETVFCCVLFVAFDPQPRRRRRHRAPHRFITQTKARKRAAAAPAAAPVAKILRRKLKAKKAPAVEVKPAAVPRKPKKPAVVQRRPSPDPRGDTACHFWARGECRNGDACPYRHDPSARPRTPIIDYTTSPLLMVEKGCEAAQDSRADLDFLLRDACVRAGRIKPSGYEGQKEAGNLFGYCSFWAGSAPSRTRTRPLPSLECQETHQKLEESILDFVHKAKPDPASPYAGANAKKLAREAARSWLKANDETSDTLETFSRDCATDDWTDATCGVHRVDNPRGQTCELVCKAAPKLRACIRLEVLFRLKRRHDHFIRATCAGDAPRQQLEQARFLTRCLVVLLKYGALLSDPGQHGMLPLAVFGTLQEWGCEGEGFATPLNATLQSYCSLHSEADRCFGSLGSFFDWRPKMGSFELNPPFTIRSTAVEDHVVELLQAAERDGKALSFCYVVPETAGRLQTRKHIRRETPFLAGELMVRASSKYNGGMGQGHVYRRGNEFQTHAKQPWDCPFTTVITWFQTTAAKEKWPVTDALKRDLLTAFAPGAAEPEAMR